MIMQSTVFSAIRQDIYEVVLSELPHFFFLPFFFSFFTMFVFPGAFKWKENLAQKAAAAFLRRQQDTTNLQKLVYGKW